MAQQTKVPRETQGVIDEQRSIQREVKKADEQNNAKGGGAMQAGARAYPEPPFPKQHRVRQPAVTDFEMGGYFGQPRRRDNAAAGIAETVGVTPGLDRRSEFENLLREQVASARRMDIQAQQHRRRLYAFVADPETSAYLHSENP